MSTEPGGADFRVWDETGTRLDVDFCGAEVMVTIAPAGESEDGERTCQLNREQVAALVRALQQAPKRR